MSRLYESIAESNVFGVLSNISYEDFNRDEFSQTARLFPVHFWFFIGYRYSLADFFLNVPHPLKLIVVTVWKSTRRNHYQLNDKKKVKTNTKANLLCYLKESKREKLSN